MWNRASLKARGKRAFLNNYWCAVLAAFLLSMFFMASNAGSTSNFRENLNIDLSDGQITFWEPHEYNFDSVDEFFNSNLGVRIAEFLSNPLVLFVGGFALIIAIAMIVLRIFLVNPLEVGIRRFFSANLYGKARLSELGFGYKYIWTRSVGTLFLRDLKIFLWSLLFIIPGIIKSYQYMMVPYLLAEKPELTCAEAFEYSKEMMDGEKWNAFVLSLSFIGWEILSAMTMNILGIFFVNPYVASTQAALYRELRYKVNI